MPCCCWVLSHHVDRPQFMYPFSGWWPLGLFSVFGYYEYGWCESSYSSLSVATGFHFSWAFPRSVIIGSYGRCVFDIPNSNSISSGNIWRFPSPSLGIISLFSHPGGHEVISHYGFRLLIMMGTFLYTYWPFVFTFVNCLFTSFLKGG